FAAGDTVDALPRGGDPAGGLDGVAGVDLQLLDAGRALAVEEGADRGAELAPPAAAVLLAGKQDLDRGVQHLHHRVALAVEGEAEVTEGLIERGDLLLPAALDDVARIDAENLEVRRQDPDLPD